MRFSSCTNALQRSDTRRVDTTVMRIARALCFEKEIGRDGEDVYQHCSQCLMQVDWCAETFKTCATPAWEQGRGRQHSKRPQARRRLFLFFLFRLLGGMLLFAQSHMLLLSITMMIMRSQFRFPLHLRRGQYRGTAMGSDKTSIFIAKARLSASMAQFFDKTTIWRYM